MIENLIEFKINLLKNRFQIQLQAETEEPVAKKKRELPPGQTTIPFKNENFYDKDSKRFFIEGIKKVKNNIIFKAKTTRFIGSKGIVYPIDKYQFFQPQFCAKIY